MCLHHRKDSRLLGWKYICNKEQKNLIWSPSVLPQTVHIKQAMGKLLELTSLGKISNKLRESFALKHE